jgi:hypothetical protein
MTEKTVKLPNNKRFKALIIATKAVVGLDVEIASATSELVKSLRIAEWLETCCMIAYRVNDCTTPALVKALNDLIQDARKIEAAQRKRISAAIGSPILADMVKGCDSGDAVLKTLAENDITSLHSLRKAIQVVKSDVEQASDLAASNTAARSQLKVDDGGRPDGVQTWYDGCLELAQECRSFDHEDLPILASELHKAIKATLRAADARLKKIEAADLKAEKMRTKKAA